MNLNLNTTTKLIKKSNLNSIPYILYYSYLLNISLTERKYINIYTPLGVNDRTGKTTNVKQQYNFFFFLYSSLRYEVVIGKYRSLT